MEVIRLTMEVCVLIPVRLESKRLPRKALIDIDGHPLLWHVWKNACGALTVGEVYVVTDSTEICDAVHDWGGNVLMSPHSCCSGTERIASVLHLLSGFSHIVNVQGDEPLLEPSMLDNLVRQWQTVDADIITPVFAIGSAEELFDSSVVKVVRATDHRALYFSRSAIPHLRDVEPRDWIKQHRFWGHVGIYGYRRDVLETYATIPRGLLESQEHLEQLRFLEAAYRIMTIEMEQRLIGVDTPDDLSRVRAILERCTT